MTTAITNNASALFKRESDALNFLDIVCDRTEFLIDNDKVTIADVEVEIDTAYGFENTLIIEIKIPTKGIFFSLTQLESFDEGINKWIKSLKKPDLIILESRAPIVFFEERKIVVKKVIRMLQTLNKTDTVISNVQIYKKAIPDHAVELMDLYHGHYGDVSIWRIHKISHEEEQTNIYTYYRVLGSNGLSVNVFENFQTHLQAKTFAKDHLLTNGHKSATHEEEKSFWLVAYDVIGIPENEYEISDTCGEYL